MKERLVVFAPEARDDLFALYDWIAAAASPGTALAYVERIETYCRGFTHASECGHCRNDIRPGLRIVGFERRVTTSIGWAVYDLDSGIWNSRQKGRPISLRKLGVRLFDDGRVGIGRVLAISAVS